MKTDTLNINESYETKFGFSVPIKTIHATEPGLSEKTIREISEFKGEKGEHEWIHKFRMKALKHFMQRPMPKWGGKLDDINFDEIIYYLNPIEKQGTTWNELPESIKLTFDKLGIPEAERKILGGVEAQFDSEVVYHKVREDLEKQGVIFVDPDIGLQKYPHLFKNWFGKIVPPFDNKFAALNSATFSGGSFIYIPKGVHVTQPLQAYFRINAESFGQFERTLIIADEGSKVHYIEGCFTKGTPLVTLGGIRPIEEVKENELVLTHKRRYKRVYHTQKRKYSGNLYRISYYGGPTSKISVTEEHPFLAVRREREEYKNLEWKTEWISASSLKKGDYLTIPINREVKTREEIIFSLFKGSGSRGFAEIKFKVRVDKDLFRLIGYYLSEGSISSGYYVTFTFNKNERENIEDVKRLLRKFFGKEPYENPEYKSGITLVLSSVLAARFFESNFSRGAFNKKLPEWVELELPEKQAELVKGMWRGDGSFMYEHYKDGVKRMFRINTISSKLAMQIRNILLRLNIFASLHKAKRTGKRKDIYTIYVGGSFVVPFSRLVGFDLTKFLEEVESGDMKMLEELSFTHIESDYAFVPIKRIEIEKANNLDVYNLSVEDDESYIANFVAVHNCTAPVYSKDSLHAAVVEIVALPGSHIRYTTLQNWSKNVYNLVTKRAVAFENATVEWVDANIGCLAKGTLIFTNPDVKPIENISPGDKIFTFNEKTKDLELRKVIATKFSGIKTVYNVILENGKRMIEATLNHPFLTLDHYPDNPSKLGRYKLIWKKLEELKVGNFVVIANEFPDIGETKILPEIQTNRSILYRNQYGAEYVVDTTYKYNNIEFPKITTDDLMWLFGLFIGNGNVVIAKSRKTDNNRYGRIIFSVPRKDNSRQKLLTVMKDIFRLEKFEERKDGVTITYNSLLLAEFFEKLSLHGDAYTKRIPKWIYTLPLSQKLNFIAGYLEADGRINKNNARLKTCNRMLLEDLKVLCIMCGLEVNRIQEFSEFKEIKINKNAKKKEYKHYVMYISKLYKLRNFLSGKNKEKIPNKNEKNFNEWHLTRTRRVKLPKHLGIYKITKIDKRANLPTFDIEVDGTHNFVANGIIVHNSKLTMKYPSVYLKGRNSRADILSIAFAGNGQHQDTGGKAIHLAPNTTSRITAKSVSKDGGRTTYRGLLHVAKNADNIKSSVRCDALLLDETSKTDTYPYNEINNDTAVTTHEATVGKIGEEQLFYLMSRGLTETEALNIVVMGFFDAFAKEIPLEYAVEFNRLIQLEMSGAVG